MTIMIFNPNITRDYPRYVSYNDLSLGPALSSLSQVTTTDKIYCLQCNIDIMIKDMKQKKWTSVKNNIKTVHQFSISFGILFLIALPIYLILQTSCMLFFIPLLAFSLALFSYLFLIWEIAYDENSIYFKNTLKRIKTIEWTNIEELTFSTKSNGVKLKSYNKYNAYFKTDNDTINNIIRIWELKTNSKATEDKNL